MTEALGTSLMPNIGIHTQITPPTTPSMKEGLIQQTAGISHRGCIKLNLMQPGIHVIN